MSKDNENGAVGNVADKPTAPYVSFKSFQTALDRLHDGIPHQIDKSVWPSLAFGTVGQILGAFRFLGLIDEKGTPQADLKALATVKDDARKAPIRKLLEKRYSDVMQIDLTKATPEQLEQAIRKYNVTGATHRKAVTFFLQAAQFANLPMSQFLQAKTKRGATPGGSRKRRAKSNGTPTVEAATTAAIASPATSRIITLNSGGKLTLAVELDLLRLSIDDRKFVFDLIDRLEEYENRNKKETASE